MFELGESETIFGRLAELRKRKMSNELSPRDDKNKRLLY